MWPWAQKFNSIIWESFTSLGQDAGIKRWTLYIVHLPSPTPSSFLPECILHLRRPKSLSSVIKAPLLVLVVVRNSHKRGGTGSCQGKFDNAFHYDSIQCTTIGHISIDKHCSCVIITAPVGVRSVEPDVLLCKLIYIVLQYYDTLTFSCPSGTNIALSSSIPDKVSFIVFGWSNQVEESSCWFKNDAD